MRSSEHKQWYKVEGGWTVSQKLQRHDFSLTPNLDSSQTRISASSRLRKLCKRPRLTRGYTDKPKSNPRTHSEYKRSWNKITKRVKKRFKFEAPRPPRAGTTTKKIKNKNYIHQLSQQVSFPLNVPPHQVCLNVWLLWPSTESISWSHGQDVARKHDPTEVFPAVC